MQFVKSRKNLCLIPNGVANANNENVRKHYYLADWFSQYSLCKFMFPEIETSRLLMEPQIFHTENSAGNKLICSNIHNANRIGARHFGPYLQLCINQTPRPQPCNFELENFYYLLDVRYFQTPKFNERFRWKSKYIRER